MSVGILAGDCRDVLRTLPDESVHCVVTSPPYWGLRDYGVGGQIGLETTFQDYVDGMVAVFREVRRVLRSDGTLWLNLGDTFARPNRAVQQPGLKPKDLVGIPWRVAFALQADGWWLRQDIIWSKPNPMPESVRDRCTKAHEYLFLLAKSERYFYDGEAISEAFSDERMGNPKGGGHYAREAFAYAGPNAQSGLQKGEWNADGQKLNRNKRSVWEVATQPFSEAHFATFPPALIEPCIKAGCPEKCCAECGAPWVREMEKTLVPTAKAAKTFVVDERDYSADSNDQGSNRQKDGHKPGWAYSIKTLGFSPSCACNAATLPGTVLDPFFGAGTTGLVADRLGRNCIGIELNPTYAGMTERRIRDDAGMFAELTLFPGG